MNEKVLAHETQTVPDELVVDVTTLVEGSHVLIIGPPKHVFLGSLGRVLKVPAKSLLVPNDPLIVVEIEGRHVTTVQCRRSNLLTAFG